MAQRTNWGLIGRISVTIGLVAATVVFFVLPEKRWISAVMVGVAILDAIVYGLVIPRLVGSEKPPGS